MQSKGFYSTNMKIPVRLISSWLILGSFQDEFVKQDYLENNNEDNKVHLIIYFQEMKLLHLMKECQLKLILWSPDHEEDDVTSLIS